MPARSPVPPASDALALIDRVAQRLGRRVDIAPLVWFRVLGGVLIAVEQTGALFTDYHRAYVSTAVHFSYPFFAWLEPWPPAGVYAHFLFNSLAALAVAAGWHYRASAATLCIGLTSLFLMERGVYVNHAYLYCLYAGLLACIPAHRAMSLDSAAGRAPTDGGAPVWALWLLRFQIAVVYVFAGIAKLDADWLAALPAKVWLADRAWYPLIGSLLQLPAVAYWFAWGGLAFDLLIVPALLWAPTRTLAFMTAILFHVSNAVVFGIGTFPWFALVATALFLPAPTLRRAPLLRTHLPHFAGADVAAEPGGEQLSKIGLTALGIYVVVQLLIPMRALLYPGRAVWTEEGATFAWRMMSRDKRGSAHFLVRSSTDGKERRIDPAPYVSAWQLRTLAGTPDLLLQFAHWLARRETDAHRGGDARTTETESPDVEVRAVTGLRLNGRPPQPLVDPGVDLARERPSLGHYSWVLPAPGD